MVKNAEDGTYLLGELVEPKTYYKLVLDSNGTISKIPFTVHAQRIPLRDLRRKIFNEHKKAGNKR